MNTAAGVCLWLCGAAAVTGLTVLCNAGGAWMGGRRGMGVHWPREVISFSGRFLPS